MVRWGNRNTKHHTFRIQILILPVGDTMVQKLNMIKKKFTIRKHKNVQTKIFNINVIFKTKVHFLYLKKYKIKLLRIKIKPNINLQKLILINQIESSGK